MKSKNYKDYMYNFISDICSDIGPRLTTTSQEKEGFKVLEKELKINSDKIYSHNFKTSYNAYPGGAAKVSALMIFLGLFFIFTNFPIVCVIISIFALILGVSEIMFLKSPLDIFYKKGISKNVFGKISPTNKAKKYIIIAGHMDSAYEIPSSKKGIKLLKRIIYDVLIVGFSINLWALTKVGILGMQINVPFSVGLWGFFNVNLIDILLAIIFLPILIFFYIPSVLNFFGNKIVPGANDNLSGVAISLAAAKHLYKNKPKNVEVWCGAFGAEEAGMRGSQNFVKDIPRNILDNSYTIVLDSVGAGDGVAILEEEDMYLKLNNKYPFVHPSKHDKELCDKVYKVTKSLNQKSPSVEVMKSKFAGTDASSFSLEGYKACSIVCGDKKSHFVVNWHTMEDIPKNLDKNVLQHVLDMILETVNSIDKDNE
jgi:hypothetical protein